MTTIHIEQRKRVGAGVRVTTLCGLSEKAALKGAWRKQDARELIRLVSEGTEPRHYGKKWTFCSDCKVKVV